MIQNTGDPTEVQELGRMSRRCISPVLEGWVQQVHLWTAVTHVSPSQVTSWQSLPCDHLQHPATWRRSFSACHSVVLEFPVIVIDSLVIDNTELPVPVCSKIVLSAECHVSQVSPACITMHLLHPDPFCRILAFPRPIYPRLPETGSSALIYSESQQKCR